jgi:hypothetical protein
MYAVFNKDGEYLYTTDKEPVDSSLKFRKLSDNFIIGIHRFVGDYETGKEVSISNTITSNSDQNITIGVSTLKALATQQIEEKYNIYDQLNIIGECLYEICDKRAKKNSPINKFMTMHSYIKELIQDYNNKKELIKKSSNIKLINDLDEIETVMNSNDEYLSFRDKAERY